MPRHRFFAREVEDQDSGNLTLNHFRWKIVPPTIDTAPTSTMILLCEHPAVVAGPVRKWKTVFVFQGASFAPALARAPAGCESAQSVQRSSLRRPGAPAGCSRCERSLDTVFVCGASPQTKTTGSESSLRPYPISPCSAWAGSLTSFITNIPCASSLTSNRPSATMEIDLCVRADVRPFLRGRQLKAWQAHAVLTL